MARRVYPFAPVPVLYYSSDRFQWKKKIQQLELQNKQFVYTLKEIMNLLADPKLSPGETCVRIAYLIG